jgi:hypothetical protein
MTLRPVQLESFMSVDELFAQASSLQPSDRLLLSDLLRDTVPPEDWPRLSPEWVDEIQRRSASLDSGEMSTATWDVVRARTRKLAGLDG